MKQFDGPGRGHHRRRIGHRPGPRRSSSPRRGAHARALRHRRGRSGRDRGPVRGARREGHRRSRVDVADRAAVEAWADEVVADHGRVNLIVNNAGVALGADGRRHVLRRPRVADGHQLLGRRARHEGVPPAPEGRRARATSSTCRACSACSASRRSRRTTRPSSGCAGFTDALRMELEIDGCGVSSTTSTPAASRRTSCATPASVPASTAWRTTVTTPSRDFDRIACTTPEKAARQILLAVERDRRRALIGPDAKVLDLVSRLPAGLYQRALARGIRQRRR